MICSSLNCLFRISSLSSGQTWTETKKRCLLRIMIRCSSSGLITRKYGQQFRKLTINLINTTKKYIWIRIRIAQWMLKIPICIPWPSLMSQNNLSCRRMTKESTRRPRYSTKWIIYQASVRKMGCWCMQAVTAKSLISSKVISLLIWLISDGTT